MTEKASGEDSIKQLFKDAVDERKLVDARLEELKETLAGAPTYEIHVYKDSKGHMIAVGITDKSMTLVKAELLNDLAIIVGCVFSGHVHIGG
jgi:biotin carboxylase